MEQPTITRAQYDAIMALQPKTEDEVVDLFAPEFLEAEERDGMAALGLTMCVGFILRHIEEHGMLDASRYSLEEVQADSVDEFNIIMLVLTAMMSRKDDLTGPERDERDQHFVDYLQSLDTQERAVAQMERDLEQRRWRHYGRLRTGSAPGWRGPAQPGPVVVE